MRDISWFLITEVETCMLLFILHNKQVVFHSWVNYQEIWTKHPFLSLIPSLIFLLCAWCPRISTWKSLVLCTSVMDEKGYRTVNLVSNIVFRINYDMCTLAFLREDVVVALDKTANRVFLFWWRNNNNMLLHHFFPHFLPGIANLLFLLLVQSSSSQLSSV